VRVEVAFAFFAPQLPERVVWWTTCVLRCDARVHVALWCSELVCVAGTMSLNGWI
jgi:hypothetical protein